MKKFVILLVVVLISTSNCGKEKTQTYTNTTFNQIEFAEITFTLDKNTLDTLQIDGGLKQKTTTKWLICHV